MKYSILLAAALLFIFGYILPFLDITALGLQLSLFNVGALVIVGFVVAKLHGLNKNKRGERG